MRRKGLEKNEGKAREKEVKAKEERLMALELEKQLAVSEEVKIKQLKINPIYEYVTFVLNDNADGTINEFLLQKTLLAFSKQGWRLHTIFTNEIGKTSTGAVVPLVGVSINATIDQTILVFERCIRSGNSL